MPKKLHPLPDPIGVLSYETGVVQREKESINAFLIRLIEATAGLVEDHWNRLPQATQDYYNEAADRMNRGYRIPRQWPTKPLRLQELDEPRSRKPKKIRASSWVFARSVLLAAIADAEGRKLLTASPALKKRLAYRIAGYKQALRDITLVAG